MTCQTPVTHGDGLGIGTPLLEDTSASDLTSPLLSRRGLDLPENLTFEQWAAIGSTLKNAQQSLMWRLGDWLLYGENKNWGEKYDRAIEATGYDYGSCAMLSRSPSGSLCHAGVTNLPSPIIRKWRAS